MASPLDDPVLLRRARRAADQFVAEEGQFHLGMLPTVPHPYTRTFSQTMQRDPQAGIRMLLAVDHDIPPVARRAFVSEPYRQLVSALRTAAAGGRRICFSGCGSTGRLSAMFEEMWRRFWEDRAGAGPGEAARPQPSRAGLAVRRANQCCSIMTGGDRALIRAVEHFEDHARFGARQVDDLDLQAGDLLVAITEGGETASVLGTVGEARNRGCQVFVVYNNPSAILREHIERSRAVIDDPACTILDLFTGPMALSGSTRMQATTVAMLVVGAALCEALESLVGASTRSVPERLAVADRFASLVAALSGADHTATLARLAELEAQHYAAGGAVRYRASRFLLDLFSDTTERSPTFALPPLRTEGDTVSPAPWATVHDPTRASRDAWGAMLRRPPRGLTWSAADYREMRAPEPLVRNPPRLDEGEIYRYRIGNEPDPGHAAAHTLMLDLFVEDTGAGHGATRLTLRSHSAGGAPRDHSLALDLPASPLHLWHHLALKLLFNTVSTAAMGILGRIRGNHMIQVNPTNKKLIDRGTRIIAELAGQSYAQACFELYRTLLAGPPADESPVAATIQRLT